MTLTGWLIDKSATSRGADPVVAGQLADVAEPIHLCEIGLLEQLYSSRSATLYDVEMARFRAAFPIVVPAPDHLDRALMLQRDLAHHHGMWHRVSIPDLIARRLG